MGGLYRGLTCSAPFRSFITSLQEFEEHFDDVVRCAAFTPEVLQSFPAYFTSLSSTSLFAMVARKCIITSAVSTCDVWSSSSEEEVVVGRYWIGERGWWVGGMGGGEKWCAVTRRVCEKS